MFECPFAGSFRRNSSGRREPGIRASGPARLRRRAFPGAAACLAGLALSGALARAVEPRQAVATFRKGIEPILEDYCYNCHGDGMKKGKVAFDELRDADVTARADLWFKVLKNVRANIMPPAGEERPSPEEVRQIASWIKYAAFGIQPDDPDPGRVTLRRLNRVEYGRTVHSLLGVDFRSEIELPPDDTGHGFDNIGDVLSVSPMLIEKYLQAADTIITSAVPQTSRMVPVAVATGSDFRAYVSKADDPLTEDGDDATPAVRKKMGRPLAYRETVEVAHAFSAPRDAKYRLSLNLEVRGPFNFDPARCLLRVKIDGATLIEEPLGWQSRKAIQLAAAESWRAGAHEVSIGVTPLPPAPVPPGAPPPSSRTPSTSRCAFFPCRSRGRSAWPRAWSRPATGGFSRRTCRRPPRTGSAMPARSFPPSRPGRSGVRWTTPC